MSSSSKVLYLQVPETQPLMEAGMDSLGAVELQSKLADRFRLELPPTLMFDYPTAAALAAYLTAQLPQQQEAPSQAHAQKVILLYPYSNETLFVNSWSVEEMTSSR